MTTYYPTARNGEPDPDDGSCTCGHVEDEHGGDPEYPGSSACNVEGCPCSSWEPA